MFNKNDDMPNERVLYKTKPNMIFGCKKAIFGAVLLAIVLMLSPMAIKFVGQMQVYLISRINLSLTRYTAIVFFVIILIVILYIIWQLLGWYSKEYTLTDSRIIVKYGVLSSKKNYMPYATIQDINTSQSFIAKLFGIGSISIFSAYDSNQMVLSNISNTSKVEEIIFSHMVNSRNFYGHNRLPNDSYAFGRNFQSDDYLDRNINHSFERNFQSDDYLDRNINHSFERNFQSDDYLDGNEYYDEFEPITPIGREKDLPRREYEYYPEDLGYNDKRYNEYEYEPYGDDFYRGRENTSIKYEGASNSYSNGGYYNRVKDEYSRRDDEYYHNDEPKFHFNEEVENIPQNQPDDIGQESSEKVIRRHFDKFKK